MTLRHRTRNEQLDDMSVNMTWLGIIEQLDVRRVSSSSHHGSLTRIPTDHKRDSRARILQEFMEKSPGVTGSSVLGDDDGCPVKGLYSDSPESNFTYGRRLRTA